MLAVRHPLRTRQWLTVSRTRRLVAGLCGCVLGYALVIPLCHRWLPWQRSQRCRKSWRRYIVYYSHGLFGSMLPFAVMVVCTGLLVGSFVSSRQEAEAPKNFSRWRRRQRQGSSAVGGSRAERRIVLMLILMNVAYFLTNGFAGLFLISKVHLQAGGAGGDFVRTWALMHRFADVCACVNNSSSSETQEQRSFEKRMEKDLKKCGGDYNVQERGRQFQRRFPEVKGEFFHLWQPGSAALRESLEALGFKKMASWKDSTKIRGFEELAIMWCYSKSARRVRKTENLGFYIVNHVAHADKVWDKARMMRTLVEFEQANRPQIPEGLLTHTFLPDTLVLSHATAAQVHRLLRKHRQLILKPAKELAGRGIRLFNSDGRLRSLEAFVQQGGRGIRQDLVLQQYIQQPLLLSGRKFHLRVFLLLVPNRPGTGVFAFCHPGYVQLACRQYSSSSRDLHLHLTNMSVQKTDRTFQAIKEDTVWSPQQLNEYLNANSERLQLPCADWAELRLYPRIRAILAYLVSIVSSSLAEKRFAFQLFGCDFLIDSRFNIWLLELNENPLLTPSTQCHGAILKQQMQEAVAVAVEVLQLTHRRQSTKDLVTRQNYRKIYSHQNSYVMRKVFAQAGLQLRDDGDSHASPSAVLY